MAGRVCVAQIGGAHGLRGEVKLKSFTAEPLAVKDYGPLETEDGTARFEIETLRAGKGHLIARLGGVRDRSAAQRLTHMRLFVPRERLPSTTPDEFYYVDLIGLRALGEDGKQVGTVVGVHNFGAGDVLELQAPVGADAIMVPFTETFVPRVDIAGGFVVVAPPQDSDAEGEDAERCK